MNNTPPALTTHPLDDELLAPMTSGEVAALYGVTNATVRRWVAAGYLPCFRTPGGHTRFRPVDVAALAQPVVASSSSDVA